ncbi:MAG: tRNA pseudouridine(38-40) synthase TruA [Anaerolineales bacterium]
MARYKAILEYDGTDFLGFQRQAVGRTVQGEVEAALARVGWQGQPVLGAGRTDTGVHAAGQVIAFDLDWNHGEAGLLRALNANLPRDVAVKMVAGCAPDFHPRFRAQSRRYRYTIYNVPVRTPLVERYAWQVWPALDAAAMQAASAALVGRHDFAAFGADPDDGDSTIRTVIQAEWSVGDPNWLYFDIRADAFLYRMVRSLVGALKRVGTGGLTVEGFSAILRSRDRNQGPATAPAHGLCLMEVVY